MPIYEYECERCHRRLELIQKRSDQPVTTCPHCHAEGSMKKLLAAPAIQFKGSGWYITDYSGKGKDTEKTESAHAETTTKPDSTPTATSTPSEKKTDAGGSASPPAPPKTDGGGKS